MSVLKDQINAELKQAMLDKNDLTNGKNGIPTLEWHIEEDKIAAELMKCTRAIPK